MPTRHSLISDGSINRRVRKLTEFPNRSDNHLGDAKRAVFEQLFFYAQKHEFARGSFGLKRKNSLFLQLSAINLQKNAKNCANFIIALA